MHPSLGFTWLREQVNSSAHWSALCTEETKSDFGSIFVQETLTRNKRKCLNKVNSLAVEECFSWSRINAANLKLSFGSSILQL